MTTDRENSFASLEVFFFFFYKSINRNTTWIWKQTGFTHVVFQCDLTHTRAFLSVQLGASKNCWEKSKIHL